MGYYDMYGNNLVRQAKLDDQKIKDLLSKIPNATAKLGIVAIFTEEHTMKSLDRVREVLNTAKNEHDLQIIEAALQTAITEIREFNARGSKYWDDAKTSLYLYALQNLILNLDKIDLVNAENKYTPQIVLKLQNMHAKCDELGVNFNIMRQQCITNQYQRPDNDDLRKFKFIDAKRVDMFNSRLKKFAVTHRKEDLFDSNGRNYQGLPTTEQIEIIIKKLTTHIEQKFNFKKLDLATYDAHTLEILSEVNSLFATADPGIVSYINKFLYDHLKTQEKNQTSNNQTSNNDRMI